MSTTIEQASPWLQGRTFASWREEFDRRGYLIFERVLSPDRVVEIRAALAPFLERDLKGRNDFEGLKTNRVYAMLAKSPLFAELAIHPLALAFAEAELGQSCLLSALLAINLHPGETVQPWHFDDGGVRLPRPRPAFGLSAFWAIDDTTELNGSTEVIPGSHLWNEQAVEGAVKPADFTNKAAPDADRDFGNRPDAVKITMPSGSLAVAKGTLWHRGGANLSDRPRLIITPQYCGVMIKRGRSDRLAPPRCQSVPFATASDPDGIVIFTASGRLPKSRSASGAALLVKSAGFTAPSTACSFQRWLPGITSVLPFNSVVSSIAQNALRPNAGRGRGSLTPPSSNCQGCTVSPGWRLIASSADSRQLCPSSASAKASASGWIASSANSGDFANKAYTRLVLRPSKSLRPVRSRSRYGANAARIPATRSCERTRSKIR